MSDVLQLAIPWAVYARDVRGKTLAEWFVEARLRLVDVEVFEDNVDRLIARIAGDDVIMKSKNSRRRRRRVCLPRT